VFKTLGGLNSLIDTQKVPTQRLLKTSPQVSTITSWFDGATQLNGKESGAGGLIRINANTIFKWTFNCGAGTNTRA